MLTARVQNKGVAFRAAKHCRSRTQVITKAATWQKVTTTDAVKANNNRTVVEVEGQRIVVAETGGKYLAVSNKCSHLGLPIVGKTALLQGEVKDGCIVCPAHKTAFDLETGQPKGDWCPGMPNLPFGIGKGEPKPLPTFDCRVNEDGSIEVLV